MAKSLSKTGIVSLSTIRPWHVSQSVDAFTGIDNYDIVISGSLTTTGSAFLTGSLVITGSVYINSLITYSNADVVTIDPITGQLFSTSSNSFNSTTNITNSISNYYTSSISNSFSSSNVTNNFSGSTAISSIIATTVTNNYITSSVSNSYTNSIVTNIINQPAPSDQYIQYNSGSTFGANVSFQFIYLSQSLQQGNSVAAKGNYSHAEGAITTTNGIYSHAEGERTTTQGAASHAEGFETLTSGDYAHSEGYQTLASNDYAHSEGDNTVASGVSSHAEGHQTISSGSFSHAEGDSTLAEGIGSHAEGYFTSASGDYQHVSGMFNISSTNKGAFIIGNGTSNANRRNILYTSGSTFQISSSLNLSGSFVPQFRNLGSVQVAGASSGIQTYSSDYNITFTAGIVGVGNKNEIILPANPLTGSIIYLQRISGTTACRVSGSSTHTVNGSAGYAFPTSLYARRMFVFHGSGWYTEPNPIV